MSKILLESSIIFLLVLIGISIFIPSGNDVNSVVIEFENSIESGEEVEDGEFDNIEVSIKDNSNFFSRLNCKIANAIVNGLNSSLEIGIDFLRKVIN